MIALIGALALSGCDADFERVVGASPETVAAALVEADIREAPGAPGTDPMRSGNLISHFAAVRDGDDVVWTVTNGGEVAVRMIAHLEPVDGGRTRVTLDYERGSAPDDHVAPAFRSRGVTLGLLAMVVEEKLDLVTMPPGKWTAKCDAIIAEFEAGGPGMVEPSSLSQAVGQTARTGMRLAALDKELKAAGCPLKKAGQFETVRDELSRAPVPSTSNATPGVTFEAGKPMVNPSNR